MYKLDDCCFDIYSKTVMHDRIRILLAATFKCIGFGVKNNKVVWSASEYTFEIWESTFSEM